jgi:hypothetical protein
VEPSADDPADAVNASNSDRFGGTLGHNASRDGPDQTVHAAMMEGGEK